MTPAAASAYNRRAMNPKPNSLWETIKAEKWWFLGPLIALAVVLVLLVVLGGGAGGQGFNYF